jgi:hypothetical protein
MGEGSTNSERKTFKEKDYKNAHQNIDIIELFQSLQEYGGISPTHEESNCNGLIPFIKFLSDIVEKKFGQLINFDENTEDLLMKFFGVSNTNL